MKLRKNFPVKILAFLLAVLCLAGCAALACLQIMEIDVLWGGEPAASSRLVHRMMAEEFGDIYHMISLRQTNDRNALQEKQLQELEERFAAKNTNLRWQIRHTGDDSLLYGNVGGELPAPAYDGYWFYFTMGDHVGITTTSGDWQSHVDGLYTAEKLPARIRTEGWLPALTEAVARWEAGDRTADPDAVYLSESSITDLLIIDGPTGMTVYAPTIRSVLEVNKHGYQYSLTHGQWIRRVSSKEYHIVMWLDGKLSVEDVYKEAVLTVESWHTGRMLALTAALAVAWLILTVCLCVWSGWRKGHEEVSLCWFHRIPGDLLLACYIFLAALLAVLFADNSYSIWGTNNIPLWGQLTIAGLFGGAAAILLTSFLITFCARCKGGVILRNMLTVRILLWLYRTVRNAVRALPLVWKTALAALFYLGATFLLWVIALNNGGAGWVLI